MNINISENPVKPNKFLNIKIGKGLFDLLSQHSVFQSEWKTISPCFYFLQRIADLCYHAEKPVSFFNGEIKNIFRPYTSNEYRKYIDALIELKLLEVNEYYQPQLKYQNKLIQSGECKQYWVTELGLSLLTDSDIEYLKKLHFDKESRRRNQKNVSYRLSKQPNTNDPIIEHTKELLNNAEYKLEEGECVISGSTSIGRKKNITKSLLDITTKDFMTPKYNAESDGRLVNSYTILANDVKTILSSNGYSRRIVVDIRACHPTFWSLYVINHYLYLTGITQSPNACLLAYLPSLSLHYDGDISDNNKWEIIKSEHNKWVSMFTDKDYDPRNVIGVGLNKDKDYIKQALNETLNGSKKYPKLLQWLDWNFPLLYKIWKTMDAKATEKVIGKNYESALMLDIGLYELATQMDLKLGYENDGFSVYAKDDNNDVMDQTRCLVNYVRQKSKEKFGFSVVMTMELIK